MNKTVLALAIFAFCLFPNVLSSNMRGSTDRELGSISLPPGGIPLGNINNPGSLGGLLGNLFNLTNSTQGTTTTNTTAPANNTNSANTTVPANNTSSSNDTSSTPANNTASTNTTQPSNTNSTTPADSDNGSSSTNSTSSTNTTDTTNTTTPTTPSTPVVNDTTPVTPAPSNWYARNDVDMSAFKQKCLDIHNILRTAVGVANVTWSDSLAQSAQAWAENMAVSGFRHSGRTGENIASTTSSTKVTVRLLGLWTNEQDWFIKGCTYPKCSSTGDEVGHYTQMVWAKTTQVGCGFAPGVNKQWNYLCCQYYRAGNVIGQTVYPYPIPTN